MLPSRRAFSLLELSMVLVISGLMVSFVLQASQSAAPDKECYATTKAQMKVIRGALENFVRKKDRLPLPAARNAGVEDITYGRESSGANIDQIGSGATGVSFGAVPFQALGLSPNFAGDCWGNKFSYAVTTRLTSNATTNGFLDLTIPGNITVKRSPTISGNIDVAYVILSHGEDELGAVKTNYSRANAGDATASTPDSAHGWCSGTDIKYFNCNANAAVVADTTYNNGKDAGANYFDDVVITSGRPQILIDIKPIYGWGDQLYGKRGNNINHYNNLVPNAVYMPPAVSGWAKLDNTCAIGNDGQIYCWGAGTSGQLGNNTIVNSPIPQVPVTLPTGVTSWTSIASAIGGSGACALGNDNLAYCWGANGSGQIGDGFTIQRNVPTQVGVTAAMVSAGFTHWTSVDIGVAVSCGLSNTGTGYCWGDNYYGELGDNTTVGKIVPNPVTITAAMASAGFTKFTKITAGNLYACGIGDNTLAYCWGNNSYGRLGDGTTTQRNTAVPFAITGAMATAGVTGFKDISIGQLHTCVLTNTDQIYCVGRDLYAQAGGQGCCTQQLIPVLISLPVGATGWISISMRSYMHSCAVTNLGTNYCWGMGSNGQTGDGNKPNFVYVPTATLTWAEMAAAGFTSFSNIHVVGSYTCGLGNNGKAYCWGDNANGQLGYDYRSVPVNDLVLPTGVTGFSSVSAGTYHSCGIGANGKAYCWGWGTSGQLGDGTSTTRFVPTEVTLPTGVISFGSVVVGDTSTCAIGNDNQAYCWGFNGYKQLGDNTTTARSIPTLAPLTAAMVTAGVTGWTSLSMGYGHTCGIANTGLAYCWGSNSAGQIGDNTLVQKGVPTPVTITAAMATAGVTSFSKINVGNSTSCAIVNTGKAYCWGDNSSYNLGDGTNVSKSVPTLVTITAAMTTAGVTGFTSINPSAYYTCGLANTGQVYCWGTNTNYTFGNGTSSSFMTASTPGLVTITAAMASAGVTGFTKVSAGLTGAYAITNTGKLYSWGSDNYGQLGDGALTSALVPIAATMPVGVSNFSNISAGASHAFAW